MIDPYLAQLILSNRKYGYLITDTHLRVVDVWGDADIFPECSPASLGRSLLDTVPELIGSEDLLAEILSGQITRTQLSLVTRLRADNSPCYLSLLELPYLTVTGEIQGIHHLIEDVTEIGIVHQQLAQRRNELQLLQDELTRKNLTLAAANAELREMNELKSAFVAIATHELRNPLTSIIGFLEMVQDGDAGPLTETQAIYLDIVAKSAERLHLLAKGLSDVIRIEAGRVEMILNPVDLVALVREVVESVRPQFEQKSQQLTISSAPYLPPALCDELWMGHILNNLVSNAIKYTHPNGKIEIQLSAESDHNMIHIAVCDNGMGISESEQKKLFTRFYRTERAKKSHAGMGLGLYIVRSLIDLHGGEIWVESTLDVGSTFHIRLSTAV